MQPEIYQKLPEILVRYPTYVRSELVCNAAGFGRQPEQHRITLLAERHFHITGQFKSIKFSQKKMKSKSLLKLQNFMPLCISHLTLKTSYIILASFVFKFHEGAHF